MGLLKCLISGVNEEVNKVNSQRAGQPDSWMGADGRAERGGEGERRPPNFLFSPLEASQALPGFPAGPISTTPSRHWYGPAQGRYSLVDPGGTGHADPALLSLVEALLRLVSA